MEVFGGMKPLNFDHFSQLNIERIEAPVKQTLHTSNTKAISWFKHLQLIKFLIFPKYLFLFCMAPLGIITKLLRKWQSNLFDFVWQYWKPRLSQKLLCSPKSLRGLAMPNLELYYKTSLLTISLTRYSSSFSAPWKIIMNGAYDPHDFWGMVWMPNQARKPRFPLSPINRASLRIWDTLWKALIPKFTTHRSFLHQLWFKPGLSPTSFPVWRKLNLTTFRDLMEGGLLPKGCLDSRHDTQLPWLEYNQVSSMFHRLVANGQMDRSCH